MRWLAVCCLAVVSSFSWAAEQQEQSQTVVRVVKDNLFLLGTFDEHTSHKVITALERSPQVTQLVFTANGGSLNDQDTLKLGRYIRRERLNTYLIEDGVIASGGVSLFLSGIKRSIGDGSYVGVHAWAQCSGYGDSAHCTPATNFAKNDRAHDLHQDYINEMLGRDDFYWFSIGAAPYDGIHWLSQNELTQFNVVNHDQTKPIEVPFPSAFKVEYDRTCHNCPQ